MDFLGIGKGNSNEQALRRLYEVERAIDALARLLPRESSEELAEVVNKLRRLVVSGEDDEDSGEYSGFSPDN